MTSTESNSDPSLPAYDAETILALLQFYLDAGVDSAIEDSSINRFDLPGKFDLPDQLLGHQLREHKIGEQKPETSLTTSVPSFSAKSLETIAAPPLKTPRAAQTTAILATAILGQSDQVLAQSARLAAAAAPSLEALKEALQRFDGVESLRARATHMVFADGNPQASVMLVGEAPGADEDRLGKPFVGISGQLLDRMLGSIGLDRNTFYITNICFWRPPGNRKPTEAELIAQAPFVQRHIELVRPKVLVLVGASSAHALLGTNDGITRLRGRWFSYRSDGLEADIPALPIFHPAFLLRQPAQKRETWSDLLKLKARLHEIG